jgi:hypothetical protein
MSVTWGSPKKGKPSGFQKAMSALERALKIQENMQKKPPRKI